MTYFFFNKKGEVVYFQELPTNLLFIKHILVKTQLNIVIHIGNKGSISFVCKKGGISSCVANQIPIICGNFVQLYFQICP